MPITGGAVSIIKIKKQLDFSPALRDNKIEKNTQDKQEYIIQLCYKDYEWLYYKLFIYFGRFLGP